MKRKRSKGMGEKKKEKRKGKNIGVGMKIGKKGEKNKRNVIIRGREVKERKKETVEKILKVRVEIEVKQV